MMLWKILFWLVGFVFLVVVMPLIAAAIMASIFDGVDPVEKAVTISSNGFYIWVGGLLWALIPAYD